MSGSTSTEGSTRAATNAPGALPRLVIMASGRGSNAWSLWQAIEDGRLAAELVGIVSNNPSAHVLERFASLPPTALCVPSKGVERGQHEEALLAEVRRLEPDLIALAGYMRVLSARFLSAVGVPVLNIHPSLLPAFPGLDAQRQAWEAGAPITGATVHVVDAGVDTGPIVKQESSARLPDESLASLSARILEIEHRLYPQALQLFIETDLAFDKSLGR